MRLLRYDEQGELGIVSFDDRSIPPYAILSHTWGADTEEVTFADLQTGDGKTKPGHEKILFCGKQAQRDNLQYFWIDTCCIDKANKAELSHAIRSMFRWYQNAARCYVYLSDVSTRKRKVDKMLGKFTWEPAFTASRWFTRGWTLQELLAPSTVEFFSKEGAKLGDKMSLAKEVREVTGIPCSALQGEPLSDFSVSERISWNEHRVTKIPTDRAYSLMGILGVSLSPFDGESLAEAIKRVTDEAEKQNKCLQDIHQTDPRNDKKRIEDTKGGLLADSYRWVLANPTFQQWQQRSDRRLLWVKGDPGKGKTMLLCGIIDELHNSMPRSALLSYFFCQATDPRINSATAVLRGLLYMLIHQQPSLISHVRKKCDHTGKSLFEDLNAWVALTEIFAAVLRDTGLGTTYLIIDALDECMTDRPELLRFIAEQSSASSRVKWIVSSRNWTTIEEQLQRAEHKTRLSLELNAESVAAAVDVFIQQKVDQLAQEKQYEEELRHAVLQHLESNANGTFLWVALVCQELEKTAKRNVLKKLTSFPSGRDALYERMMQQISASDDGDTLVEPSVFSTKHETLTAGDTLINADTSTNEAISFMLYTYENSVARDPEDRWSDVESILSRGNVSEADTTASIVAYQHAATDIITKALLDDSELSRTYIKAIERVGEARFLRNNRKLLQWLSKDLQKSQLRPSESQAVRFLRRSKGSQLVSAAIYHDLVGAKMGLGNQSRLEPHEDKKIILSRFLDQIDSGEQVGFSERLRADDGDGGGDVVSSEDENENDDDDEERTEKLEATVKFLVSGQPFQVYKQRLREWLHLPPLAQVSTQNGTSQDPIFALTLPLFVEKVLRDLSLPILEPEVSTGKARIYWTSGSKRMFDDFIELDPGAAVELEKALQKRYVLSDNGGAGFRTISGIVQHILGVFRSCFEGQQQPYPDAEQGERAVQTYSGRPDLSVDAVANELEVENPDKGALRLLLCVADGGAKTKLEQKELQNINDDRELFTYLRKQYFKKRNWFTLRSVGALTLAQFDVNYSNSANVYRHEHVCGITTDEHLDRALGFYCLCIPPEERVGDDKEYLCNPAPKSRNRRLVPVLGPTMLKQDFLSPHFIETGQVTTLNQLPKRRSLSELRATPDHLATGWGLYIEEDWHWPTIYCCFVVIILLSFAFGIGWSVKRNDIQGAFAVSGFALTLGAMFLGYLAIPKT